MILNLILSIYFNLILSIHSYTRLRPDHSRLNADADGELINFFAQLRSYNCTFMMVNWTFFVFLHVHDDHRYMLGLAAVRAIIQSVSFLFMPRIAANGSSVQNRDFQAMEVLRKIRGPNADIEDE